MKNLVAVMNPTLAFEDAFSTARSKEFLLFEWRNRKYTTELEEELKKNKR